MKKFIVLLVLVSYVNGLFANDKKDMLKTYPVFSLTKYEKERVKIWKHFKHRKVNKWDKAYIALEDLNGDGVDEIFAYIDSFDYCGQMTGCYLYIFKNNDKKLKHLTERMHSLPTFEQMKIGEDGSQSFIAVLREKYNGWNKLLKRTTILKYNGKFFEND